MTQALYYRVASSVEPGSANVDAEHGRPARPPRSPPIAASTALRRLSRTAARSRATRAPRRPPDRSGHRAEDRARRLVRSQQHDLRDRSCRHHVSLLGRAQRHDAGCDPRARHRSRLRRRHRADRNGRGRGQRLRDRAAALTAPAPGGDTTAPSAPASLRTTGAAVSSIDVAWNASSDNVGVTGYGLYSDGASAGSTGSTSASFTGLACGRSYTLGVDAYDAAGNRSTRSTITASTAPACRTRRRRLPRCRRRRPPPSGGKTLTYTNTFWRLHSRSGTTPTKGLPLRRTSSCTGGCSRSRPTGGRPRAARDRLRR